MRAAWVERAAGDALPQHVERARQLRALEFEFVDLFLLLLELALKLDAVRGHAASDALNDLIGPDVEMPLHPPFPSVPLAAVFRRSGDRRRVGASVAAMRFDRLRTHKPGFGVHAWHLTSPSRWERCGSPPFLRSLFCERVGVAAAAAGRSMLPIATRDNRDMLIDMDDVTRKMQEVADDASRIARERGLDLNSTIELLADLLAQHPDPAMRAFVAPPDYPEQFSPHHCHAMKALGLIEPTADARCWRPTRKGADWLSILLAMSWLECGRPKPKPKPPTISGNVVRLRPIP